MQFLGYLFKHGFQFVNLHAVYFTCGLLDCLLAYLLDYDLDDKTKTLCDSLERQLNAKLEAIDRQAMFTSYKMSLPGSVHREATRREYISKAGIPSRYVSGDENHL